ncbi:MAG TPA: hypothetical protein VJT50_00820 [Pyrinomonadaceae bacterium]|nr:hypothetical protein [Pyrinomonadaceae bacterium]
MNFILKMAGLFIGLTILALVILRLTGVDMGMRVTGNLFAANSSIFVWLLAVLSAIELLVVASLLYSAKSS